ncbi:hypothetical protein MTO96_013135 [Rhipicephalus appendiculatus]
MGRTDWTDFLSVGILCACVGGRALSRRRRGASGRTNEARSLGPDSADCSCRTVPVTARAFSVERDSPGDAAPRGSPPWLPAPRWKVRVEGASSTNSRVLFACSAVQGQLLHG